MNNLKVWHFSDTHTFHGMLKVPEDIDIAIFSGDCSNPRNMYENEQEVLNFLTWYSSIKAKYKIFIAGNHDMSVEAGLIPIGKFQEYGIIYLENESVNIEGLNIWGSPITPSFGVGWAFNKKRDKLHDLWQTIPDNTDIVVVHGPPKGILDLSYDRNNNLEFCGCLALKKRMLTLKLKACLFGHIHNNEDILNAGIIKLANSDTIFSNGACVYDGKFSLGATSNGNIIEI